MSLAAGQLTAEDPVAQVELPADLARVLAEYQRTAKARDDSAFAALFTDDALYPSGRRGWVRGRRAIRDNCCPAVVLQFRANAFGLGDSTAYIVGTMLDTTQGAYPEVARFTLTLRRARNSGWLISSRMTERLPVSVPIPFTADNLITGMDSAGIRYAAVLSVAYWFGSPPSITPKRGGEVSLTEEYSRVRGENDWTAQQVARYPTRLAAFCSFNPIKPYALEELERCARHGGFKGLKLHLANSDVDLRKPEDVAQLRRVFRSANQHRLAIIVHLRPRLTPYGRQDAELFLRDVLPEAPDIPVQIAHLAGWGGYDDATDAAAAVFAEAFARRDPRVANLYFDLTTIAFTATTADDRQRIANRIRQIGVRRMLYGSDMTTTPGRPWLPLLELPLSPAEFEVIAANVLPYFR